MNVLLNRTLALLGLIAAGAAPAFGAATLKVPATPGPLNITEDGVVNWTMTTNTPTLVNLGAVNNFSTAFNAWNNANGKDFTLNVMATNAALTVTQLTPSLSSIGDGDLKFKMTLAYPAGVAAQGPTPINGPWGPTNAVWTQSVTTNDVLGTPAKANSLNYNGAALPAVGFSSYMDISTAAGVNQPPAYPYQYNTSFFYDDPSRQGVVGSTVYWQGDAMLSTITDPTYKNGKINTKGVVTVYADVAWGFSITGTGILPNGVVNNGPNSDIGSVPGPPSAMGFAALPLVGLLIRRKRN